VPALNVLLSAYACEPGKGSEPGVGWHWARELAGRGHRVSVITRANNREAIETELRQRPQPNLRFLYYDLPRWARWWKKGGRGIRLYYTLWQWGAYRRARRLAREIRLDCVHHITFGGFHLPTFMGRLNLPFVLGPVGGGERAPLALRRSFPWKRRALERVRDAANAAVAIHPVSRASFSRASVILCKTGETAACIPAAYRDKCRVQLEIGTEPASLEVPAAESRNLRGLRVLYMGRLLYWKGLHLALRAFAEARRTLPEARLTVIGSGPDESWLRGLARSLELQDAVEWIPWLPQQQAMQAYSQHDALLFPSLHESSGNVVLEALARALPVVCLDLGGPGVIVDSTCGRVVKTAGRAEPEVIRGLAEALVELTSPREWQRAACGALARAQQYRWETVVGAAYAGAAQTLSAGEGKP
jgi:glycosyltransferase involved in cell wall biosynthesis